MGMGDKSVRNLEQFGRANISKLSHVEEQSTALPEDLYQERWVPERGIE
jgi:hypothetical protein